MNNMTIISKAAVAASLYTEQQLASLPIFPLRSYAQWKAAGFQVKRGEHAVLSLQLWHPRKLSKKQIKALPAELQDGDDHDGTFFLRLDHLFDIRQVEPIPRSTAAD